jgi:hypothetical protein
VTLAAVTRERAEFIARAHACENCGEYTCKKLVVKAASDAIRDELKVLWIASKTCGVCGRPQELGIDEDGDIVFVS